MDGECSDVAKEQNTFQDVCQIGLKSVHENLETLHEEIGDLQKVFEHIQHLSDTEELQEASPDIDVIETLFQKISHEIPTLLEACHKDLKNERFWQGVRHDLRASIGGIKSYAELISEDFSETAPEDFLKALDELSKKISHLLPLVTKIIPDHTAKFEVSEAEPEPRISSLTAKVKGVILIIDDDPQKRHILRRQLEVMGHTILESPDGPSGLQRVHQNTTIDLILLDMLMPGMSGHDVLKVLKKEDSTRDLPVLIISSLSELDSVVRCIEAGADDYLEVPVDPILLNARVNFCLEKKKAYDREKQQSQELKTARNTLHAAMESIEGGFAIFDAQERLIMKNKAFSQMYPSVEMLGGELFLYSDFLKKNMDLGRYLYQKRSEDGPSSHNDDAEKERWFKESLDCFRKGTPPQEVRFSDGRWIEIATSFIPTGGFVSLHKDITERKQREQEIQRRADFDGLTGLANRAYFDRLLKAAFERASKKGTPFALVFFDLDGFKKVNDDLGHDFGDLVLTNVSEKLRQTLRQEDLIARLGGDEFCALIYDMCDSTFLKQTASRCLEAVGTFVEREGVRAHFGVSIGIAVFPGDANSPEELLSNADAAMYDAKKAGKGRYRLFSEL